MTTDEALAQVECAGWALLSLVNQTLDRPDYLCFIKQKVTLSEYRTSSGRGSTPADAILAALAPVRPRIMSLEDFLAQNGGKA